jgi:SAM-dependent methyltransferase
LEQEKIHEQAYWDEVSTSFGTDGVYRLWRRHSDHVNLELLQDWLPVQAVSRLLKTDLFDEAISSGLYPFLASRSAQVEGIDISARAVDAAARKYPELKTHLADLRELPLEDCAFDCVVSNSTLDHFQYKEDIHLAIAELFRVTRPGGFLLVTMDNLQNPMVWLRNHLPQALLQKAGIVPYYVGRTLTRSGLVKALQQAGFETLESRAIMHCPRAVAVARAGAVQKSGDADAQNGFLDRLLRWERLGQWPSRWFTGYFVAVRAKRPE